ncbi:DUF1223 domain-containing protein [soil metagenome]
MKCTLILSLLCFAFGASAQGVAVIELFTSQGCSSCPPADKNLTAILKDAAQQGKPVFGLSFHVDYWNYIGWKDPYSSKEYTARQKDYSRDLGLNSIYTPQMIVNGKKEFVGSDKGVAEKIIEDALRQSTLYSFTSLQVIVKKEQVQITYSIDQAPMGEVLNFAFVENRVENLVAAGENAGKNLAHNNIVKAFRTVPLEQNETIEFNVKGFDVSKTTLIAYVQDKQRRVVAATSKSLQ